MKRDTLTRYLRHLVMAALPLASGCCHDSAKDVDVSASSLNLPDLGGSCDDAGYCPPYFVNCDDACGAGYTSCSIGSIDRGSASVHCEPNWCTPSGRRPSGLAEAERSPSQSELGALFAQVAHLEAASVHAFVRLQRELAAHGAPPDLVARARAAARDEARHARVTRRLARRFGAVAPRPRVARMAVRPLHIVAVENAVEGCVRELWGALVASFQARASSDPEVRAAMAEIARDEIAHAELSLAIDRWARPKLKLPQRRALAREQRLAVRSLATEALVEVSPALQRTAGLPNRAQARWLFEGLYQNKKWG